ncbi:tRNA-splicing endonuclease subunit [Vanrija albida]|uniref:tRNA-splicing endonuclease subunit Sen34 n=1 Tax=Vanrija albida TaxID=181172 RepID=A0ABR3Q4F8_9TREE
MTALPSSPGAGPSSIPLYLVAGVGTVWDAQAAATIHCAHDISGLRTGTLPGVQQQNGFLGLPVTLMPEETALLVNTGRAHLVPVPSAIAPPSAELVAQRTAQRIARSRALAERMRADEEARAVASKAKFEAAGEKARLKREERQRKKAEAARAAALAAGEEVPAEVGAVLSGSVATPPPPPAAAPPTPTAENTNIFTVVPGAPVLDALVPRAAEAPPLPTPHFPFPAAVRDSALADSFAALHTRGYRMGLGPRFGGEWLIYPGDYLRYHAHFTSQVIVRDDPIRPAEIVAWGRLGTGTKKAGLLCCWDDGKTGDEKVDGPGDVEFYSLEWANFG